MKIMFRCKFKSGAWNIQGENIFNGNINITFNDQEHRLETVGQCTGLKDKNGKLIFEGDIVKNGMVVIVKFGRFVDTKMHEQLGFYVEYIDDDLLWNGSINGNIDMLLDCEVVGNIHDNPELLGGK